MQLHQLKRKKKNKKQKRVGRGGLRGKTSGRGHKGQKARAGHRIRPEIRDAIKKLPKLRGYGKNRARTVNSSKLRPIPVNIKTLEENFLDGERVNPKKLVLKGIIDKKKGRIPPVKILGAGVLSKKLEISNCAFSKSAKEQIEKAGGSVEFNTPQRKISNLNKGEK